MRNERSRNTLPSMHQKRTSHDRSVMTRKVLNYMTVETKSEMQLFLYGESFVESVDV